jgi:signal transduction histidine kinase/ActR/RegA family two-component response regulator
MPASATQADLAESRILVLAPAGRDARTVAEQLERGGYATRVCGDAGEAAKELGSGAGALVIGEEALTAAAEIELRDALSRQPSWSELPLIVLTSAHSSRDTTLQTLAPFGAATLLERPVRLSTLASAARAALRSRRRQYAVRDQLVRLQGADQRRNQFLAALGHELRNPLATLRTALYVLEEIGGRSPAAARQRELMQRQVRRLVRLVDDLLEVSRVTLGTVSLLREPVELHELLDHCLQSLGLAEQAAARRLRLAVAAEAATVDGDRARLEQVVSNLVQNAITYTPPGGEVAIDLRRRDDLVVLRVRDNGAGMAAETMERLFEPFTHPAESPPGSAAPLGLGLPLVRALVELHGGAVEARSPGLGQGSELEVRLPAGPAASPAPAAQVGAPRPSVPPLARPEAGEPLRLLVVEDNADAREALASLLGLWGYRVETAADGVEGVAKAIDGSPDVALVDVALPGCDGTELARRVRAAGAPVRLIAMTGFGLPDDRRRGLEAGFDDYLVKPVDPQALGRTLNRLATEIGRRAGRLRAG